MDWIPPSVLRREQQQQHHHPRHQHQHPTSLSTLTSTSTSASASVSSSSSSFSALNQRIGRFQGRNSLSPSDAIFASLHQQAQYQLQQHLIRQNALRAMRFDEIQPPTLYRQPHLPALIPVRSSHIHHAHQLGVGIGHSHSQSEPTLPPLPLIAYAGSRSSPPSLSSSRASVSTLPDLDDSTTSLILRMTSLPPSSTTTSFSAPPTGTKKTFFPPSSFRAADWRKLPNEAFDCILVQLRNLHLSRSSTSCSTCYMRDLVALQLTSRSWFSLPQKALYTNIAIHGFDSNADANTKKGKTRTLHGGRLHLLRRTLRSKPRLAALVTTLHVPDPIIPIYLPNGDPNPQYDDYICLLASLVMTCSNLQSFTGFHAFYNHTFDRLTHALSTRTKMRQHVWIIAENIDVAMRAQIQLPPGLLDAEQSFLFSMYHERWSQLETLMLCSPARLGVLEHELFIHVLHSLPMLKNLCVSSFDADDFGNLTLLSLPPLISLRLEECAGITDAGISKWAGNPAAAAVERLCLVHQNITSLVTIAKVLAGLERLKRFSIVQSDLEPTLPLEMVEEGVVLQPLFASNTLRWLHWDIACHSLSTTPEQLGRPWRNSTASGFLFPIEPQDIDRRATYFKSLPVPPSLEKLQALRGGKMSANTHLALSILHSGFPSLKYLRAPRDVSPPGVLQSVCLPATNANVLLPEDRFALHLLGSAGTPKTNGDSTRVSNSLQMARIRAQRIIDAVASRRREFMKVVITDHSHTETRLEVDDAEGDCSASSGSRFSSGTEITEPDIEERVKDMLSPVQDISGSGQDWGKEVLVTSDLSQPDSQRVKNMQRVNKTCSRCLCHPASTSQEGHSWGRACQCEMVSSFANQTKQPSSTLSTPLKVQEFSLPSFVGRVSLSFSQHGVCHPPTFHLLPDIPGRDGNGGITGWGDLLRVREREKVVERNLKDKRADWIDDEDDDDDIDADSRPLGAGCSGVWNKARVQEAERKGYKKKAKAPLLGKRKAAEWWRHTPRPTTRDAGRADVDDFF